MKQLLCIYVLLLLAPAARAQAASSIPGAQSLVPQKGAYVYRDTVYFTKAVRYSTLSFGAAGIAYEAFDMSAYPTNDSMKNHFWGMKYNYRLEGNHIEIGHISKWSDGRLHRNYEYGTIENGRIILTHESSDNSKRKRPLARIKVYVYDETLTAKPAWVQ